MRRLFGVLIAAALALAVFFLWPRNDDQTRNTEAAETSTTAPTTTTATIASTATTATSAVPESHVVETVEEAEAILRELWFGWFEGIYNQDETRIREVVATNHQMRLAAAQFGAMAFKQAPAPSDISYVDTELLRNSQDCTVVFTRARFSGFAEGASSDVHVLRWSEGWKIFSLWSLRNDMWEGDCEAALS